MSKKSYEQQKKENDENNDRYTGLVYAMAGIYSAPSAAIEIITHWIDNTEDKILNNALKIVSRHLEKLPTPITQESLKELGGRLSKHKNYWVAIGSKEWTHWRWGNKHGR